MWLVFFFVPWYKEIVQNTMGQVEHSYISFSLLIAFIYGTWNIMGWILWSLCNLLYFPKSYSWESENSLQKIGINSAGVCSLRVNWQKLSFPLLTNSSTAGANIHTIMEEYLPVSLSFCNHPCYIVPSGSDLWRQPSGSHWWLLVAAAPFNKCLLFMLRRIQFKYLI